jgi:hypothetical protein
MLIPALKVSAWKDTQQQEQPSVSKTLRNLAFKQLRNLTFGEMWIYIRIQSQIGKTMRSCCSSRSLGLALESFCIF